MTVTNEEEGQSHTTNKKLFEQKGNSVENLETLITISSTMAQNNLLITLILSEIDSN